MSQYIIEINDSVVKEQISNIVSRIVLDEIEEKYGRRSKITPVIEQIVKDMIYTQKDKIVEMVVDRATKEIVRKGLPKLLERAAT